MPDINITVAHKVAVSDTQSIVCDNSDYTVHWTLDEEWAAYDTKTMRAIYMDGTFTDKVFNGDTIALPVCTVPGVVQIGLFAGDIRASHMAIMRALPSVRSAAGAPADPTPDVYDQLMELIKGLGGVDPDDIAKAVADYLAAHPIEETDPTVPAWAKAEITGAAVGQIAKIAAVDTGGVPTAWKTVGAQYELLMTINITEEISALTVTHDENGNPFSLDEVLVYCDSHIGEGHNYKTITYKDNNELNLVVDNALNSNRVTQFTAKNGGGFYLDEGFWAISEGDRYSQLYRNATSKAFEPINTIKLTFGEAVTRGRIRVWGIRA